MLPQTPSSPNPGLEITEEEESITPQQKSLKGIHVGKKTVHTVPGDSKKI